MKRETFDDLWDKADKEYGSQGNNSFTFKHHLFAVLDDELKEQPKLSIPKKIGEELERVAVTNWEIWEFFIYAEEFSNELKNWLDDNTNSKIAIAYLAGKALGVELVEVER